MKNLLIVDHLKLLAFALGVFISYFVFGIYHQRIYDENSYEEKFEFASTFVVLQSFVYFVVAKIVIHTHKQSLNETPHKYYIMAAIFSFFAQVSSNWALYYISYIVQVVGKSCKPIVVMIFGVIIARKKYTIFKYFFTLMIVAGIGIFFYKCDGKKASNDNSLIGNLLIFVSLLIEGLLGGVQDKMRVVAKPTSLNFMLFINLYGTIIGVPLLFVNLEVIEFWKFCMRHPQVTFDILAAVACGTIGQFFITAMIYQFGSLPLAIVTTIRKFFTAVFLAIFVQQPLNNCQWIGTIIIFTALILDVFFGKKELEEDTSEKSNKNENVASTNTIV